MAKPTLYTEELVAEYTKRGYWTEETLSDIWDRNARDFPDGEAIVDSKTRLTWREANQWIDRLALGFLDLGFQKDDMVVVQLPNCVELLMLRLACERAGLLCLPVLRNLRHREVSHALKSTEAVGVVIPLTLRGFDYFKMIEEIRSSLPRLRYIFVTGDEVPEGAISIKEILERPLEDDYPPKYLDEKKYHAEEYSLVAPTTGTTGLPKFVGFSIRGLIWLGRMQQERFGLTVNDISGVLSPPALAANTIAYFGAPLVGGKIVLLERFEAEAAFGVIERERVTIACLVPAQLAMMVGHPNFNHYDLSSLRLVYSTGGPLFHQVAMEAEDKIGCPVLQGYGSVDSGGVCGHPFVNPPPPEVRFQTVGKPFPGCQIRLVDDVGKEVAEGEVGEIWVRGPTGASGYHRNPEATKRAWTTDGWYKTGDLGRWDEQGNLMIVGRKKDMIIRGGQNIYPIEVESMLRGHPKIADAAVIGMPDPVMGERACAYAVLKGGQDLSFEEMVSFLKGMNIAPYKLPERLELLEKLPVVGEAKVDKKVLYRDIEEKLKSEGKL